ncbi:uncharacterized protein LOC135503202 isoform X2 [Lineus longissimus]
MGDPLYMPAVRKEQRRVAALLQVDADPPRHKKKRKPLSGEMFWCSHLDPEGNHRDPALDYIRQAFREDPKMTLDDLRTGFRYIKEKNDALFDKAKQEDDTGFGKKRNRRRDIGSKSVDFDPRTKHRDKENEYKNLRNNLSKSSDELKLPNIKETNLIGRLCRKEKKDDGKERMHVRLPNQNENARDGERRHPEFLRSKKRGSYRSRGSRKNRNKYDSDSAFGDTTDDEYPDDPRTLLSDSGMARTPSELSEMEPHLRYSHGMNPNPGGEEFTNSQLSKDSQGMMKITSFLSEKSFCSCGADHRVRAPCTECHRTEAHSKKCSKRRRGRRDERDRKRSERRGRRKDRDSQQALIGERDDRENPQTLIGEREPSQRCLKCGKVIKGSRETSYGSGIGRPWSRDSSESSGSYRLIRSSSESRIGTPEGDRNSARSRSVSPPRDLRDWNMKGRTSGENLLDDLERKLREGAFDYDLNVRSVDDINQTIRIPRDGDDNLKADDNLEHMRKPRGKIDMYREAYIRALSVARSRNLPSEPWMFGNRTSRAFVYSYYHYIPRRRPKDLEQGPEVKNESGQYEPPKIIKKRGAEMKMIFGNVNPDDYLPGGPKNPFEPNPLAYVKHERDGRVAKGLVGRRRVQMAKPTNMKSRKVSLKEREQV